MSTRLQPQIFLTKGSGRGRQATGHLIPHCKVWGSQKNAHVIPEPVTSNSMSRTSWKCDSAVTRWLDSTRAAKGCSSEGTALGADGWSRSLSGCGASSVR